MKLHFFYCTVCGKIIAVLTDTGTPTICCGKPMQELIPNRTDGSYEKHVPVFSEAGRTVTVKIGSEPHPMEESHSILWIGLRSTRGFQLRELHPGDLPETVFSLAPGESTQEVYAYCNLHGLWCSEPKSDIRVVR